MQNKMIYWLLNIKLVLFKWLRYIRSKLFSVSEVLVINNDSIEDLTFRFVCIKILKYIQSSIQSMIYSLDYKIEKAHIIKNYPEGQKTIIIEKEELTVEELVNISEKVEDKKNCTMGKIIYMKFEIECPQNGIIDVKDYLIKYTDKTEEYAHTLRNILIFNGHEVDSEATVSIKTFNSGKLIHKTLSYDSIKNKHLLEFDNIEHSTTTNNINKIDK